MKKSLSLILILCMMLSLAPAAFAADKEVCSAVNEFTPDEGVAEYLDEYNGEAQLEFYAASMMEYGYIPDMSTSVMAWGSDRLSEGNQVLYYTLRAQMETMASGEKADSYIDTKLVNEVTEKDKDGNESTEVKDCPITFSYKELEIEDGSELSSQDIMTKAYEQLDFDTVMNLLLMDMPYELYWYDKTEKTYNQVVGTIDKDKKTVTIDSIRVVMPVSEGYRAGSETAKSEIVVNNKTIEYYSINSEKIQSAKAAAEKAQEIIKANEGKSDYEKLLAFKNEICKLAAYDHSVDSDSNYGDQWQMIYVFDGKEDTKVVCEGYAKAFQYLCDNGGLSEDTVCYTVTGKLRNEKTGKDENHMWNIVKIGDKSYLVDVTNSDEGTVGNNGELFLVGTAGSVDEGYSIKVNDSTTLTYVYDAATKKLDNSSEILTMSSSSYEYTPTTASTPEPETTSTPAPAPEHTAGDKWEYDTNSHWQLCKVSGHSDKLNEGEHEYGNYQSVDENEHKGYCTACGLEYTGSHIMQEDTSLRIEPTVTEKGSATYNCTKCGYTKTEELPSLSQSHTHAWDSWGGDESYHWKECKAEKCYIDDNANKDSYGEHQWDEGTVTKEATEKEAGVKTFTCSVCSATKTEQIPVVSKHNWSNTYSHDSKTHWLECSDSSCTISSNKDKSGYGEHSYGAYRVISAATATTNGLMQHECLVCGYSETVTIPASGVTEENHTHSWGSWQFTSPNYWERTCSTCGNREVNVVSSTTTTTTGTATKYTMVSGANQTWLRGNGTALSFRADIPFSEFGLVKLNGVELPSSYYTASEGSTIITLNDSCTSQLSTGVHTIAIYSKYGDKVETNFMVQNSGTTSSTASSSTYAWASPKTGDSADMGLWVTVMAISLLGMTAAAAAVVRKGRRE